MYVCVEVSDGKSHAYRRYSDITTDCQPVVSD